MGEEWRRRASDVKGACPRAAPAERRVAAPAPVRSDAQREDEGAEPDRRGTVDRTERPLRAPARQLHNRRPAVISPQRERPCSLTERAAERRQEAGGRRGRARPRSNVHRRRSDSEPPGARWFGPPRTQPQVAPRKNRGADGS
ncbi:hypothetical protein F2P81_006742 [Scophthalmus maximus]|uniref:Uncharacterized protein n=1 Tax=Scophthalmus maximus TaxID=52904 RepID=A0A6A4TCD8_SCOMX|nr:hypothetical protein F2P81_006742 [Scophthalmus maximus]